MTQNVWCETFWILYFRSIDCFSCEYRMCICEGSPLKIYRMFCNGKRGNGYSPLFSGQCCSMDLVVLVTRLRFDCFNHSIPTLRTRNTHLSNINIIKTYRCCELVVNCECCGAGVRQRLAAADPRCPALPIIIIINKLTERLA